MGVQNFRRKPFSFLFYSTSKLTFPKTWTLYLVSQIGKRKLSIRRERFDGKKSWFVLIVWKIRRMSFVLIPLVLPTFTSQLLQTWFPPFRSQSKLISSRWVFNWKTKDLLACIRFVVLGKLQIKCFYNFFFDFQTHVSTKRQPSSFPLVSETNFCKFYLFVRWKNCPFLILEEESRLSESSEKCYFHWCRSILKHLLLSHCKFDFIRQGRNQKENITKWVFNGKSIAFIHCIRNPIIRNNQKAGEKNFFCFNYIFEHLLPQNYRLHLFHQGRNRKLSSFRCLFDGRNFLSGSLV